MMSNIIYKPTCEEIDKILKRIEFTYVYHKKLYRRLNDLRGFYPDNPEKIMNEFSKWCSKYYKITRFNSTMYYHYIMRKGIDLKNNRWEVLVKFLEQEKYLSKYNLNIDRTKFHTLESAVRWIVAYRMTMTCLDFMVRRIDCDKIKSSLV